MAGHGGARNRSGPQFDPNSLNSDRKGRVLATLPVEGCKLNPPRFPLAGVKDKETGKPAASNRVERKLWRHWWSTPQAVVWHSEPWRWMIVAEMCRLEAHIQLAPESAASLISQLHRFRDQLGLTPAGLKENGWKIGGDQSSDVSVRPVRGRSSRERLKVVGREN